MATKFQELADAEHAQVEAEEAEEAEQPAPADEPEQPEQPEAAPEPEQPPSSAQVEQAWAKADKEDDRHAKRYREIFGRDLAGMQECPRCLTRGFVYAHEMAPLDPAQADAVRASIGDFVPPAYVQDPQAEPCNRCQGWGETLTGAHTENGRTRVCPDCQGLGWRDRIAQAPPAPAQSFPLASNVMGGAVENGGAPPKPEPYFDPGTRTWRLP